MAGAPPSSGTDDTIPATDRGASSGTDKTVPALSSGSEDTVPASASDLADAEPSPAPAADQRYRLGAELGRGGMGRVVEAYDTHLGRTVALKEVLPSGSTSIAKRFAREVKITARLEHASIVPLYDAGVLADGRPFYVMRRVSGRPLDELIARAKNQGERLALLPNVLAAIDAIGHAHRRGVIHRDLKPANILVGELGETVVIDWGLAKVIGEEDPPPPSVEPVVPSAADSLKTQLGAVFGTPGFMSPEQARGDELDPRSDVYALGATLYQLIAGKPPLTGSSATEVIASTLTKRATPIAKKAPSTPPELAAIIDKALSFEAPARYADAAALAEDVRRFTTGQLVAAHRYTRRQRLARFARKHRAALSVAALAAAAVAVLSWVSVHRVLEERDAATAARAEAERQRGVADTKAEEARQRADQLLLAHARSLVDTSPTTAIAALEHLESRQTVDGAKAVARAAVMRGVAWGVRSLPGMTTSFELTRDGRRLVQVNRDGALQVVDLEHRKQIASADIGRGSSATWVDGDRKLLIDRSGQPPALLDPTAPGTLAPLPVGELRDLAKTPDGAFVAFVDANAHVGVLDVAAGTATQVWGGTAERSLAIAPDASWVAFGERVDKRSRLVVVDRSGTLLTERPGSAVVMAASPTGLLAVSFFDEIVELRPRGGAVTKLPLDALESKGIHFLAYRDDTLDLVGVRNLLTWRAGRLVRGDALADTVYSVRPAGNGVLVAAANDNNVHLVRRGAHLVLSLTDAPEGMYRVAAAPGGTRVAATAKDAILVWDVADLFPAIADTSTGVFVGRRRMLVPEMTSWYIWDLDAGTRTPVKLPVDGIPLGYQAVVDENRAAVLLQTGQGNQVVGIRADGTSELLVDNLGTGFIAAVPGNAIIYSLGKNRVFGKVGRETSRELVTLDGDVVSLAPAGTLGYAALSSTGELVKGTFAGASFARAKIADLDKAAFAVADTAGTVFVASGNRLLRWRGDVQEMARFATPIDSIASTELGLYVALASKDVFFVPATGNQTPQRVPISSLDAVSADGRRLVGRSPGAQVEIVDMPALAAWTLPKLASGIGHVVVSPDGARVLQNLGVQSAVWRLPEPGTDFQAWLAELTNATEDDGHVRWPWQP